MENSLKTQQNEMETYQASGTISTDKLEPDSRFWHQIFTWP